MRYTNLILALFLATSVTAVAQERLGSGPIPPSGLPGGQVFGVDGGVELIVDGSFEGGTPNAAWNETSTNFGTPLCDTGTCGVGGGTGPNTGDFWAFFGGIAAIEDGSVDQDITIPVGTATLSFALEVPIACDNPADFIEARVDGTPVFRVDSTNPECAGAVGYAAQVIDISDFADGGLHNIEFFSSITGANGAGSNFFVDDVSVLSVAGAPPPVLVAPAVPTLGTFGLIALCLLLFVGSVLVSRKSNV